MNRVIIVGKFDVVKKKDWDQQVIVSTTEWGGEQLIPIWIPQEISVPQKGDSIFAEGYILLNKNGFLTCKILRWQSKKEFSRRVSAKTGAPTPNSGDDDVPF